MSEHVVHMKRSGEIRTVCGKRSDKATSQWSEVTCGSCRRADDNPLKPKRMERPPVVHIHDPARMLYTMCGKNTRQFRGLQTTHAWPEVTCGSCLRRSSEDNVSLPVSVPRECSQAAPAFKQKEKLASPIEKNLPAAVEEGLLIYTIDQLAKVLGTTPKGIYQRLHRSSFPGELPPPFRVGGRLAWRPVDVQNWIAWKAIDAQAAVPGVQEGELTPQEAEVGNLPRDKTDTLIECVEHISDLAGRIEALAENHRRFVVQMQDRMDAMALKQEKIAANVEERLLALEALPPLLAENIRATTEASEQQTKIFCEAVADMRKDTKQVGESMRNTMGKALEEIRHKEENYFALHKKMLERLMGAAGDLEMSPVQQVCQNSEESSEPDASIFWNCLSPGPKNRLSARLWNRGYSERWGKKKGHQNTDWEPSIEQVKEVVKASGNRFRAINGFGKKALWDVAVALEAGHFIGDAISWFNNRKW